MKTPATMGFSREQLTDKAKAYVRAWYANPGEPMPKLDEDERDSYYHDLGVLAGFISELFEDTP